MDWNLMQRKASWRLLRDELGFQPDVWVGLSRSGKEARSLIIISF
jgi:hypothetical protein